jgi:hypothetical protein
LSVIFSNAKIQQINQKQKSLTLHKKNLTKICKEQLLFLTLKASFDGNCGTYKLRRGKTPENQSNDSGYVNFSYKKDKKG